MSRAPQRGPCSSPSLPNLPLPPSPPTRDRRHSSLHHLHLPGDRGVGGRDESRQSSIEVRVWEGRGRGRGQDESGPEGSAVSAMNGVRSRCRGTVVTAGVCVYTRACSQRPMRNRPYASRNADTQAMCARAHTRTHTHTHTHTQAACGKGRHRHREGLADWGTDGSETNTSSAPFHSPLSLSHSALALFRKPGKRRPGRGKGKDGKGLQGTEGWRSRAGVEGAPSCNQHWTPPSRAPPRCRSRPPRP